MLSNISLDLPTAALTNLIIFWINHASMFIAYFRVEKWKYCGRLRGTYFLL